MRFQSTLNTSLFNADIQLLGARGPKRDPLITPLSNDGLVPVYYGHVMYGAGIRAVPNADTTGEGLTAYTFKLELTHQSPFRFDQTPIAIPDDYMAYVIGFDRDFYNVFRTGDQLTATLEWASEAGVSTKDEKLFPRPFSNDLISRLAWNAGDFARSSIGLRGVYDLDLHEHIIETTYTTSLLSLNENVKLSLSVLYMNAEKKNPSAFSQLPDNTSLAATLRWDF